IGNVNFNFDKTQLDRLEKDPRIAAMTPVRYGQATVANHSTEVLAMDAHGTAPPHVLSGRLPRTASEIALGPKLSDKLHAPIGSTVRLSLANSEFLSDPDPNNPPPRTRDLDLTVVGEALTPIFGESELAQEAIVTTDAIAAAGGDTRPELVLANFRH